MGRQPHPAKTNPAQDKRRESRSRREVTTQRHSPRSFHDPCHVPMQSCWAPYGYPNDHGHDPESRLNVIPRSHSTTTSMTEFSLDGQDESAKCNFRHSPFEPFAKGGTIKMNHSQSAPPEVETACANQTRNQPHQPKQHRTAPAPAETRNQPTKQTNTAPPQSPQK